LLVLADMAGFECFSRTNIEDEKLRAGIGEVAGELGRVDTDGKGVLELGRGGGAGGKRMTWGDRMR
jgi:hypothetical protein